MLSPSSLFFGTPDPEPSPDEKPEYSGDFGLWQEDEADEQTEIVSEQARQRGRRSPALGGSVGIVGGAAPGGSRSTTAKAGCDGPDLPPPGLMNIGTDRLSGTAPSFVPSAPGAVLRGDDCHDLGTGRSVVVGLPLSHTTLVQGGPKEDSGFTSSSSEEGEDADDERSHLSSEGKALLAQQSQMAGGGQAPLPSSAEVGGLWYSELPSIGSANHFSGTCDRCCFHPKGRCLNGFNCQHCHFDHEKRKRKNKKKSKAAKQLQPLTGSDAESITDCSVPVSPADHFGGPPGGMLPPQCHVDMSVPSVASVGAIQQQGAPVGFPPQPPSYFPTAPRGGPRQPQVGEWYPAPAAPAPLQPPQSCPGATSIGPGGSDAGGPAPPGFDVFGGQLPGQLQGNQPTPHGAGCDVLGGGPPENAGYPRMAELDARFGVAGDQRQPLDSKNEYIRQLEAENRYLRSCLMQCTNGHGSGNEPPPPMMLGGCPQPSSHPPFYRPPEAIWNEGRPAGCGDGMSLMPDDSAAEHAAAVGQMQYVGGCGMPSPSAGMPPMPLGAPPMQQQQQSPTPMQGLSPSAAPFWPGNQVWHDAGSLDQDATRVATNGDVGSMFGAQPNTP